MHKPHLHNPEKWTHMMELQAEETRVHRRTLYEKVHLEARERVLDVGCGTGVITADMAALTEGSVTAVDVDDTLLAYAQSLIPRNVDLVAADVLNLPFADCTFDLVVFSVVLSHLASQQKAVDEMARVTQKEGIVLATMEPDHAGAFCYPEDEAEQIFSQHFKKRGFDTSTGRKLKYLFVKAGLDTEIGICTDFFTSLNESCEKRKEKFLNRFHITEKLLLKNGWTEERIKEYKQEQLELIQKDLTFSFTPAFYAIGTK